jgi:hypothetical protein
VLRTQQQLLDSCIVLVVPILSADAHERRGKYNRLNQNGPDEMGWRANPTGLNLNRDWVKAETPEMRALISSVYTQWWPELLVDNHTTDGADYQHDLTYGFQNGPQSPDAITRWFTDTFEGRVLPRLSAMGHLPAPYINFRGPRPESGIDMGGTPPRFSTGYPPLHARAALLVETHMLKPYGDRVKATYDLLVTLLDEIRQRPAALAAAVRDAENAVVERGRDGNPARRGVALATRTTDRGTPFAYRGKRATYEKSEITGGLVPRYSDAPYDTTIMVYRDAVSALTVQQPVGYIVPQEWTRAIDALQVHGIRFRRIAKAYRDTVEMVRVTGWSAAGDGSRATTDPRDRREAPAPAAPYRAGDLWAARPAVAALAVQPEAQSPDGLLAWNVRHHLPEEYGEDYVMEPIARQMAKDPRSKELRPRGVGFDVRDEPVGARGLVLPPLALGRSRAGPASHRARAARPTRGGAGSAHGEPVGQVATSSPLAAPWRKPPSRDRARAHPA